MPEGWGQSARRACRFPTSERLLLTYSRSVIWNSIVIPVSYLRYRPFEIRRVSRLTAPIFGIQCTTSRTSTSVCFQGEARRGEVDFAWNGSAWQPWEDLGDLGASVPAAISLGANTMNAYVLSSDGATYQDRSPPPIGWAGRTYLISGYLASAPVPRPQTGSI